MIEKILEREFTTLELGQIYDELVYNPRMKSRIGELIHEPDPRQAISDSITKALINEFDPNRFPESSNDWLLFRSRIKKVIKDVVNAAKRGQRLSPIRLAGLGVAEQIGAVAETMVDTGIDVGGATGNILSQFNLDNFLDKIATTGLDILVKKYTNDLQLKYQEELAELMNKFKAGAIKANELKDKITNIGNGTKPPVPTIPIPMQNELNKIDLLQEQKQKQDQLTLQKAAPYVAGGLFVLAVTYLIATKRIKI